MENSLKLDVRGDRVESKEWYRVCHNPLINITIAVKVWLRPKSILLFRCSEVQWKQFKLDQTGAIDIRTNHWFFNEPCQPISVGLPALFYVLEPRLADVRLSEASVVNSTEVGVGHVADKHISKQIL